MQVGDQMFISYPSAVQYKTKGNDTDTKGKTGINQLIWGDWARIDRLSGNWVEVFSRRKTGWVRKEQLQTDRLLEVNFVDIGQGDGCHIQTPQDRAIVIDAGEEDNMYRFLRWRFGKFSSPFKFESFIMSHPDKDHYYGFKHLFEDKHVHVEKVYHNTIIEQVKGGKSTLGSEVKIGKKKYLNSLVQTLNELKAITESAAKRGRRLYPNMLNDAIKSGRVEDVIGLLASDDYKQSKYMDGYSPDDQNGFTMKLLGPVPKKLDNGKLVLPKFSSTGYTKNGHSVVILLEIGSIKMLLGGDLNEPSQEYLLEHYTGLDPQPRTPEEEEFLVNEGKKYFGVDVVKACHHGSAHILPAFLKATNTLVTVVSSGDNEPHSHPRPDTLGLLGKFSRSERPLIFSTELARSGNEHIKHPNIVRRELRTDIDKYSAIINNPNATASQKQKASDKLEEKLEVIQRTVSNYGMINIRTDGHKMIIAQRLERERSKSKRWDIYQFEVDVHGRLKYVH
ncbi:MAG: hypothetical protein OEX02_12545 [Cyclobacteriaceae bacterium]|nr:hypothetical protein [Cyclobacteriaceae bacterium]